MRIGAREAFSKAWRDDLGKLSARQADITWAVLGRATSWAYDGGLVTVNPFLRGGQLYHGTRADKVWTDEQQLQFQTSAPKKLHLPFMMGVWLGQRQGRDVKSILEKHYLGRDQALGEAAIHSSKPEQNLQNGLQSGPLIVAVE